MPPRESLVLRHARRVATGPEPELRDLIQYWRDRLIVALRREPPIPHPNSMLPVARAEFRALGGHYARLLVDLGGLRPAERVLEVGSGAGRVSRHLTRYLSAKGSYEGMDVIPRAVEWCRRTIGASHRNFSFRVADVRNAQYNPTGRWDPSEYSFPFPDDRFDFAFTISVFTHMLPDGTQRYLKEMARVLRPGARCLNTFFLLTPSSEAAIRGGGAARNFAHLGPGYRSDSAAVHERAVAYSEPDVRTMYGRAGLLIEEPIRYGQWTGADGPDVQDVVMASKPSERRLGRR